MIHIAEPHIGEEELKNIITAVNSGWISSKGKFIQEFEEIFADYCGVKYGVATSNGTVALHLALSALEIKEGDEVIIPSLTFIATANAVKYTGAKPVFVDSHPHYWCIDPEKIEEVITTRTKVIIPVHLYGHPCDMDPIIKIAKKYKLFIVEDAAEAHGAEYKGRKVGSFGNINCFSFYGNKIVTTGEGGMCLTNDKYLAKKLRILRDHGMSPNKKYWHDLIGFNYRMTNMQAAIGVAQLKKIDNFIIKKRNIAKWYREYLTELENLNLIKLHPELPWAKCVYWMYSILLTNNNFKISRDNLISILEKKEVETRPFFNPIHMMPPYKIYKKYVQAEDISIKGINLPTAVSLKKAECKFNNGYFEEKSEKVIASFGSWNIELSLYFF
jgi:perosamine synthetase